MDNRIFLDILMRMRSIMFVPGSRSDRFGKALMSDADLVCLDLEDAVSFADKNAARMAVTSFLASNEKHAKRIVVRINDPLSALGSADLGALGQINVPSYSIMLPKIQTPDAIDRVLCSCPSVSSCIGIIETPEGLSNISEIARHAGIGALVFGSADWAASTGSSTNWDALLYARSRLLHAAAEFDVVPLDGAWLDLLDLEGLQTDCEKLSDLGFRGRIALHPKQVALINQSFTPGDDKVRIAKELLAAAEISTDGVFVFDGRMVDQAIIRQARLIVDQSSSYDRL